MFIESFAVKDGNEALLLNKILEFNFVDLESKKEFEDCLKQIKDYSAKKYKNAKFLGALENDDMISEYFNFLKTLIIIQ